MEGVSEKLINHPAAPTLPVSVEKKKLQQQQPTWVQIANMWTFFNGVGFFAFGVVVYYILTVADTGYDPSQASWQETLLSAVVIGMLCCGMPQAAAGALALLLPCDRWRLRRAAAYAALAITVASHCMFAGAAVVVMVSYPRDLFCMILGSAGIFVCAVSDLLCFLALLRGEWAH